MLQRKLLIKPCNNLLKQGLIKLKQGLVTLKQGFILAKHNNVKIKQYKRAMK